MNLMSKMELTLEQLAEMNEIAMRTGAGDLSNLPYSTLQQVLVIKSLELLLAKYGIDLPLSVDKLGGFHVVEQTQQKR